MTLTGNVKTMAAAERFLALCIRPGLLSTMIQAVPPKEAVMGVTKVPSGLASRRTADHSAGSIVKKVSKEIPPVNRNLCRQSSPVMFARHLHFGCTLA
jgi:hypothetical protein